MVEKFQLNFISPLQRKIEHPVDKQNLKNKYYFLMVNRKFFEVNL
jgi:hypothetical protein